MALQKTLMLAYSVCVVVGASVLAHVCLPERTHVCES
jgi:hypothetical protein